MKDDCDLNDVMRAIGNLEGKVDSGIRALEEVKDRLDSHATKIDALQSIQNQMLGKQTVIGAVFGFFAGWVGTAVAAMFRN